MRRNFSCKKNNNSMGIPVEGQERLESEKKSNTNEAV